MNARSILFVFGDRDSNSRLLTLVRSCSSSLDHHLFQYFFNFLNKYSRQMYFGFLYGRNKTLKDIFSILISLYLYWVESKFGFRLSCTDSKDTRTNSLLTSILYVNTCFEDRVHFSKHKILLQLEQPIGLELSFCKSN